MGSGTPRQCSWGRFFAPNFTDYTQAMRNLHRSPICVAVERLFAGYKAKLITASFSGSLMEKLEFIMRGSKGDNYRVVFQKQGLDIRAFCTCKAGRYGTYCRHRTELMDGDITNLLSSNTEDVERLYDLLAGTNLETIYQKIVEDQNRYEKIASLKNNVKSLKKDLSSLMYNKKASCNEN
jgi:hypothetical protein